MLASKTYLIYYVWPNTAQNHAGMAYLVQQIKLEYPGNICLIKVPDYWNTWSSSIKKAWHSLIILYFKVSLRENDTILFMEFLGNCSGDQAGLAIRMRSKGLRNKMAGLVHLSPSNLKELYNDDSYVIKSLSVLDKILVFGTSLEHYFIDLGFRNRIRKTFHYVDTNFYHPSRDKQINSRLRAICMGSLKRNFSLLKEIIDQCPFMDFDICMGKTDFSMDFKDAKNVTLHGYLAEKDLLRLMQQSDLSLSVLHDTVGSNVIVTSMATGLINVVSDVGSIHDYCSKNDSCLCSTGQDFIEALLKLFTEKNMRQVLSKNALKKANDYDIKRFLVIFPELVR